MVSTDLTTDSLQELVNRFGTFHDGIVDDIHFDLSNLSAPMKLNIRVIAHSQEYPSGGANVTFEMSDIVWTIIRQPKDYDLGLILRLNIDIFDDEIYFDFYGSRGTRSRESYEVRLTSNSRGSMFAVACRRCLWSVTPYENPI